MNTYRLSTLTYIFIPTILLAILLLAPASVSLSASTEPDVTPTVDLVMEKKFSGSQEGYVESNFSFHITGNSVNETVPHGDSITLEAGSYTIEEIGPDGFVYADWRIQWSGQCEDNDENNLDATITIDEGNIDEGTLYCRADNQYRPENNDGGDDGDGGNGGGTDTATLNVVKIVNGTSTSPDLFSFLINGADETGFETDGSNALTLSPGTYSITETAATGYATSYDNCSDISLTADDSATCTITNTYEEDNGGGNSTTTEEYRIEGHVWHDIDEDEAREEDEDDLTGWTVTIVNVNDQNESYSTTTDGGTGYYYFDVPAGTWKINQTLQQGWRQTSKGDGDGTYTVTVPQGGGEPQLTLWFPLSLFVSVAHAAVVETYSGYDFGNVYTGDSDGGDGGDGDDTADSDEGGGGIQTHPLNRGGSSGTSDGGVPQVLGEQVTIVPAAAPNAGFGGASRQRGLSFWIFEFLSWFKAIN